MAPGRDGTQGGRASIGSVGQQSSEVAALVTFEGCEELRRGVPLEGALVFQLCQEGALLVAESDLVLTVFVAADVCALIIVIFLRGRKIKPAPAPAEHGAAHETIGACDARVPQQAANLAHQESVLGRPAVFDDGSQGASFN
eukprot:CAMPEP_0204190380 /NCGR_PEP_ID=MMETSP0361-20130328/59264_1 /ASSEMBLY_ACC=CAM_ASM_000343 /TAXON_ID=268821 /ORGANISM="Scrippsiella Hangoei, Strain SHTV-5" /LENGTH=141 /DNA_ID=CAMNT_0051151183 /DNA_START=68 /DNA_END=494 /DNA_ORIENTATION=+